MDSERVSSADEALKSDDVKLALRKIIKKLPKHRYNR